jgi:predicted nucleotidyltransferase
MDRETIQITGRFIKKMKKRYNIKKALLFGSRARGDNFINSDFDFIFVSDDFSIKSFAERMSDALEMWDEKYDLEALCYTQKEFDLKKATSLIRRALKEGKNL